MTNSERVLDSLDQQDLEQAELYLKQALQEDQAEVLLELAAYLEGIGFFPQARTIYQKLAHLYPESYLSLAAIAAEDGDLEGAFGALEEIPAGSENYVPALMMKADLYQLEGLPDVARERILEALSISQDSLLYFALAELDMELGAYKEAISSYAQLDNREIYAQTGVSTYQRIGLAYASLGKFEVAIDFLKKALDLEYEDQTAYELATLLYDREEYQQAAFYFKQLDTLSPDFEGYEYAYALSLHAEHKTKEALKILEQGLEKNPFDTRLYLLASQYSYEEHDPAAAKAYLLTAKRDADDLEEIHLRLSNLYLEAEAYEDVLALDLKEAENPLTLWNLAKAHQGLEQEEEALTLYQEIADKLEDNPDFLESYAYLLREMGYLDQAKEVANHYFRLVPDDWSMQDFFDNLD